MLGSRGTVQKLPRRAARRECKQAVEGLCAPMVSGCVKKGGLGGATTVRKQHLSQRGQSQPQQIPRQCKKWTQMILGGKTKAMQLLPNTQNGNQGGGNMPGGGRSLERRKKPCRQFTTDKDECARLAREGVRPSSEVSGK